MNVRRRERRAIAATTGDNRPTNPGPVATTDTPTEGRPTVDPFVHLIVLLRWACVVAGLLAVPGAALDGQPGILLAAPIAVLHAAIRTLRPVTRLDDPGAGRTRWSAWFPDLVVVVVVVELSGGLGSPFMILLAVDVLTAGLVGGYTTAALASVLAAIAVGIPAVLGDSGDVEIDQAMPMALVLVLTSAIAGYSRTLFVQARHREAENSGRMEQLTEVNRLLLLLHGLAQTLPESLDLHDTLDSARDRLRELVDFTSLVVLIHEESNDSWAVALAEGARPPAVFARATLPGPLAEAVREPSGVLVADLDSGRPGLADRSCSGLYVALPARGRIVGLLAIEHRDGGRYGDHERRLLTGLADSLGLAVDNARWFRRLRALGAEEERTRIARDLHDRLAQSLVYVTFELDRIVRRRGPDPELERMRDDVRRAVGELRETLVQLRTTVTEDQTFEAAAHELIDRFERRTAIETSFAVERDERCLPHRIEQEILRILQEALSNVERHADATAADVRWSVADGRARLEVRDDGRGFEGGGAEQRTDSFGIVGMYERADTIGASLTIDGHQGEGTTVVLELDLQGALT